MNELGEFLKSERLKKGMTLEEIQEITKIRTRYLKAIEEGDFSVMPAMVYAKGFVKSYAEALGLDGNEIVKKYEYLFKEKEEENLPRIRSYKKTTLDLSWLFSALKKVLVSILIIGIIGYGFYYFFAQIKKGLAPVPPKQEVSQTVPENKETPSTPSTQENVTSTVSPKTVIERVSETPKKIEYKISPASQSYRVEINIVGEKCWFSIKVDGNVVYEGLMTAGMMKTFEVKNDITILMGYPPAVKISVDGEELPAVSTPSPVTINIHI